MWVEQRTYKELLLNEEDIKFLKDFLKGKKVNFEIVEKNKKEVVFNIRCFPQITIAFKKIEDEDKGILYIGNLSLVTVELTAVATTDPHVLVIDPSTGWAYFDIV